MQQFAGRKAISRFSRWRSPATGAMCGICIVPSWHPTFILARRMAPAVTSFVEEERCLGASTSWRRPADTPHTPILTLSQCKAVLPIYKGLTEENLLQHYVKGQTRNVAEPLNSKIWLLCPEAKFARRTVVGTVTANAVLWFKKRVHRLREGAAGAPHFSI